MNCEQMMNFGLKIRKNEDIVGYSRWGFIRSFEGYRYIIRKHNMLALVSELVIEDTVPHVAPANYI